MPSFINTGLSVIRVALMSQQLSHSLKRSLSNMPLGSSTAPSTITESPSSSVCLPRMWLMPSKTRSTAVSKQLCGTGSYCSSILFPARPPSSRQGVASPSSQLNLRLVWPSCSRHLGGGALRWLARRSYPMSQRHTHSVAYLLRHWGGLCAIIRSFKP